MLYLWGQNKNYDQNRPVITTRTRLEGLFDQGQVNRVWASDSTYSARGSPSPAEVDLSRRVGDRGDQSGSERARVVE